MTLEEFRLLPYTRCHEFVEEEGGSIYCLAWIKEIPECKADGKTVYEAMLNLDFAFDDYVEAMLEFGSNIPKPSRDVLGPGSSLVIQPEDFELKFFNPFELPSPAVQTSTQTPILKTTPEPEEITKPHFECVVV